MVVPDQFVDRTTRRAATFFGRGLVGHVAFARPFCGVLSKAMAAACAEAGAVHHVGGTYVCIEGPQFSTRAESKLYRSWGVDVIGMTNLHRGELAREAELCYVTLALVTDYDCWHDDARRRHRRNGSRQPGGGAAQKGDAGGVRPSHRGRAAASAKTRWPRRWSRRRSWCPKP